jgi:outer membrane protein assembly factor BamB
MRMPILKKLTITSMMLFLAGCSGFNFFDKDNTPEPKPLKNFTAEIKPQLAWSAHAGTGAGSDQLKMGLALDGRAIYVTNANGVISAIDKTNGQQKWQSATKLDLTTGPGTGSGIVAAGSLYGDIIALRSENGSMAWKAHIPGEILAAPAIQNGIVVVKAVDGHVVALAVSDGHELWSYQEAEPSLILRGASSPVIKDGSVFVGYANGNLSKINLRDGESDWTQTISVPEGGFAIQRMIDIDADPVIYDHRVYAATYQGHIAALKWQSGEILWSHEISSYTGMAASANAIYVTDAQSRVWGLDTATGDIRWRQEDLQYRNISAPALIGQYVLVGDSDGYVHWLNSRTGQIAARVHPGSSISANPVVENNTAYILTSNGRLYAYQLR